MPLLSKLKNVTRRVLQSWGSTALKRKLWNAEFARGRWDYIDNTPGDCVYAYLQQYAAGASILDLGCGSGNTGNELDAGAYGSYTGVDVSDVAVQKATARSQKNGRIKKNEYFQSDILAYVPTHAYRVILFRESIFYIPLGKIKPALDRYARYLEPGGVFVIRICDREKYAEILQILEQGFEIVDKYLPEGVTTVLMVVRPLPPSQRS